MKTQSAYPRGLLQRVLVVLALCVPSTIVAPAALASEAMPQGTLGWSVYAGTGDLNVYAADPGTACSLTAMHHMGTPLLAMRPAATGTPIYNCKYDHFMPSAGPFWYGGTMLMCEPGYVARWPGSCVKHIDPPAPASCSNSEPGKTKGDPVQIVSGSNLQFERDLVAGRSAALTISRTYRSQPSSGLGQSAGLGWSFSFDRAFVPNLWSPGLGGSFGDGTQFRFERQPDMSYRSVYDKHLQLRAAGSDWLITTADGSVERYALINKLYKLVSINAVDGGSAIYQYDAAGQLIKITDQQDRSVAISWVDGTVSEIAGPDGGVKYEYEQLALRPEAHVVGMARLTAVHYYDAAGMETGSRRYHYEDARQRHFLTGITDENGIRFATFAYNEAGQAVLAEHAGGVQRYAFAYPGATARVVTDPLGTERNYGITYIGGTHGRIASESQPAGAGCGAGASATIYTPGAEVASTTDFNGQKTCFLRDSVRGLEITRFSGLSAAQSCPTGTAGLASTVRVTSTRWHPDLPMESAVAQANRIETLAYNGEKDASGKVQQCAMGAMLPNGKPIAVLCSRTLQATTDGNGASGFAATRTGPAQTWTYTYDADGRLLTRTGPRGANGNIDQLTLRYYADTAMTHHRGDLASATNGAGEAIAVLDYTPNGAARVVKMHDGRTISVEIGTRGRVSASTVTAPNGASETTRYRHDAAGQLTEVVTPDGAHLAYGYDDAHRLTSISDAAGNRLQMELDLMDNPVRQQIIGAGGEVLASALRSYDALNRVTREQTSESDLGSRFAYDKNGNLASSTDPLGRTNSYVYDGFDRLVQAKLPAASATAASGTIALSYSHLDQLVSVSDPRKLETRYQIDGLDRLSAVVSRDTGTTSTTFDDAGQLASSTDANGRKVAYQFDAAGRINRIGLATYSYGAPGNGSAGRLTGVTDPSGQSSFSYDGFGRLMTKSQLVGVGAAAKRFAVSNAYGVQGSATGHLVSMTYPSGNRLDLSYGADGKVAAMSIVPAGGAAVPILGHIVYQPFGAVASWHWGSGGNPYARSFDTQNRVRAYPLGHPAKGGAVRTLSYDAAGRIVQTSHAGGLGNKLDQRFVYDGLDRLTGFDSLGTSQRFQYDANGNRTQFMVGSAVYSDLIDPASNRLTSTTGPTPARRNMYDASGALTSDGIQRFSYDASGRLASAITAAGTVSYRYNGLGQRVAKTVGSATTYYVYDQSGHLLGEYDSNGTPLQETVYLDDLPVAVIKPSPRPAVYYVYADHLGAARVITRASDNAMVWRWDNAAPFGEDQPDESPARLEKFTYNPRFPGQVYDRETNTHYNYFRDYDPQLGRYIQSDPIGLNGGINTYAYVGGNPLAFFDPDGLTKWNGSITFVAGQAGGGGGASTVAYTLVSECLRGQRFQITGSGVGAYMGIGLKVGASTSAITLNDGLDYINPYVFNGSFDAILAGASFGVGYGWSGVNLGGAHSSWSRSGYIGLDAGITSMTGRSSVSSVKLEKCTCEK